MQRTGSLFDLPVAAVIIFTVAVAVLVSHLIITNIQDATTDDQMDQETLNKAETALEVFDYGIIFANIAMYLAAIVFAFRIPSNPLFLVPGILFLTIAVWFSSEISNIFDILTRVSPITDTANQFPNMLFFFDQHPIVTALFGILLIIGLYAKVRPGPGRVTA